MSDFLPEPLQRLVDLASDVVAHAIAPQAEALDRDGGWPQAQMAALREAGLLGLTVPSALGGHGQGLLGLAAVTETLARGCASTAMCYGMHCVGTAVIAAKATPAQEERYLRPIAEGAHVTSLALSETGTGAHFFLPQTGLRREGDAFVVEGEKQFVTNGARADSYVVSTRASDATDGEFSCIVVDADAPGLGWGEAWQGLGMRGNSSRAMRLAGVRVPAANLLGEEGDQTWYVFEVVAPYFLTAMAGTYVGVARSALDLAIQHLKTRRHGHSGLALADAEILQHHVGRLWAEVEKTRLLVQQAARLGDLGSLDALTTLLASKAEAARAAVHATNEAMSLGGGIAYRENSTLARLLRDARASHVMSPTTDLLTLWTGRSALGRPLF